MEIHSIVSEALKINIGLLSSEQCYFIMYSIVRAFQVKRIVEIGTYKGYSSIVFCQAILDNKQIPEIFTVDLWKYGDLDMSPNKKIAFENFKECGFMKYIHMIDGDSKIEIPILFKQIKHADLCFIDGNHGINAVTKDYDNCKNYSPILLFHDTYTGNQPYLIKAKNEGWNVITFPTRDIKDNNSLVGISLALKI